MTDQPYDGLQDAGCRIQVPPSLWFCTRSSKSEGSLRIARDHLEELGSPEIVLDEGSIILPDFLPRYLVGAVALAEKTYVSVKLLVEGEGGHAASPDPDSPPTVLTGARSSPTFRIRF